MGVTGEPDAAGGHDPATACPVSSVTPDPVTRPGGPQSGEPAGPPATGAGRSGSRVPVGRPATSSPGPASRVPAGPAVRPRPLYTRPDYLLVLVAGGAVGTLTRYLLEGAAPAQPGEWPWTTFWINVAGSFLLGSLVTALARRGADRGWRRRVRIGAGTGFCGGLTTYSTFVVEVDALLRGGWLTTAVSYALVSVVVGVLAALAGVRLLGSWPRRGSGAAVAG